MIGVRCPPSREEPPTRNQEIARLLDDIAVLLELQGDSPYRVGAYREAARRIENMPEDIEALWQEGRLREIPGVGESIAAKIDEYLSTGQLRYYEYLKREVKPGVASLLSVPGLGPRRARLIYDRLGVTNIEELAEAARQHQLRTLPGLGARSEENILREIHRLQQRTSRMLLGVALPVAEHVVQMLRGHPAIQRASPAGSIRRMRETIGDIDILIASSRPREAMEAFTTLPIVKEVLAVGGTKASILTREELQIDARVVDPANWGAALQYFTGSKSHNIALRELAISEGYKVNEYGVFRDSTGERVGGEREEDVYRILGLSMIPPELRENRGEIEAARFGRLPKLVERNDIKGDLHVHTDWSDGSASLPQMVEAARALGYQYLAITDHSGSLGIAHGLLPERLREQRRQIDRLNESVAPFRILAGSEVDIRADGTLNFDDRVLADLEIVTASVHSAFGQSRERMTQRIVRALRNPHVDVLNHPMGRLLNKREGYDVDLEIVLRAAAETGTIIEINSSPERLDLDDVWARRAKELGVTLVINTDAHSPQTLANMRYGVAVARRGWLEAANVLNTLPVAALLRRLRTRRRAA